MKSGRLLDSYLGGMRRTRHVIGMDLFLRLLALIHCVAFASLRVQLEGLVGIEGILPADEFLSFAEARLGGDRFTRLPTIFWWIGGAGSIEWVANAGMILALLAALLPHGFVVWLLLWGLYLSLVSIGQDFLSFQWDILLLETTFLALFCSRPSLLLRSRNGSGAPTPARLLVLWLLFRLMFSSGVVKLSVAFPDGSSAWRDLTALTYHYETQCLPPWTAWFLHHLPLWFHQASEIAMFAIELVVPFFILGPVLLRRVAFAFLVVLQIVIIASGNYGFFNWLTICLCLPLLNDESWPLRLRKFYGVDQEQPFAPSTRWWIRWTSHVSLLLLSATLVLLSVDPLVRAFRVDVSWPAPLEGLYRYQAPFRLVNGYGLFANMTTERPELVVEGSNDGKAWLPYEFRYKPGDVVRRPLFVAPHQPRLDWQMWFAALGGARQQRWFSAFVRALLEGRAPVLELLERNPFPEEPPRFVRVLRYQYRFTTAEKRKTTGEWWTREPDGVFLRPVSLR